MSSRASDATAEVQQLFDAKAGSWSSKYAPDGRLADRLTRLAGAVTYHVPAGASVLDLGCGTGDLAGELAAAGLRVTGCDISPEMLHRAALSRAGAARGGAARGGAGWVQLDPAWRRLPFRPGAFDAVVASSVLEYVGDPAAVLGECARVIRPGGMVLCTVPDLRHPVRWLEWVLGIASHGPLARAAGRRIPRIEAYRTYLRISRQRHSARWWAATTARTGLLDVRSPLNTAEQSLRLLAFQRPPEMRNGL